MVELGERAFSALRILPVIVSILGCGVAAQAESAICHNSDLPFENHPIPICLCETLVSGQLCNSFIFAAINVLMGTVDGYV
jgi:hypothetical protein